MSTVSPKGAGACVNEVSFAYPEGVARRHPEFVAAHQGAYWETAREDDRIALMIQAGRDALTRRGENDRGPVHPHLEAGIISFHDWLAGRSWRMEEIAEPMAAFDHAVVRTRAGKPLAPDSDPVLSAKATARDAENWVLKRRFKAR